MHTGEDISLYNRNYINIAGYNMTSGPKLTWILGC